MTKAEIDNLIITNQGLIGKVIKDLKCYWHTEDEFQDIYDAGMIGLIRGAKTYNKSKSSIGTYLYTCIKNEICKSIYLSEMQKRKINKKISLSLDQPCADDDTTTIGELIRDEKVNIEKEIINAITSEEVRNAISKLKPKYQQILKLKYGIGCEQQSIVNIAKILGCSRKNVYALLMSARRAFKRTYKWKGGN